MPGFITFRIPVNSDRSITLTYINIMFASVIVIAHTYDSATGSRVFCNCTLKINPEIYRMLTCSFYTFHTCLLRIVTSTSFYSRTQRNEIVSSLNNSSTPCSFGIERLKIFGIVIRQTHKRHMKIITITRTAPYAFRILNTTYLYHIQISCLGNIGTCDIVFHLYGKLDSLFSGIGRIWIISCKACFCHKLFGTGI